jgi:UDPglucose 6-dehydrogenase
MNIVVIGTGIYLSETGIEFICVVINDKRVETIQNEILPIYESHLDVLFDLNMKTEGVTCLSVGIKEANI